MFVYFKNTPFLSERQNHGGSSHFYFRKKLFPLFLVPVQFRSSENSAFASTG